MGSHLRATGPVGAAALALSLTSWTSPAWAQSRVVTQVVIVGDGITYGYNAPTFEGPYFYQLFELLGGSVNVGHMGHPDATVLSTTTSPFVPYGQTTEYGEATSDVAGFSPDAGVDVIIMLGTDDATSQNWGRGGGSSAAQFASDYAAMIDHFASLTPQPLVYSVLPPVIDAPVAGPTDPDDCILRYQIIPIIRQVAGEKGSPVIDVYGATAQHPEYFVDPNTGASSVYPNIQGHAAIAQAIDYALEGPAMDYGSDYAVGGICDGGTPIALPEGGLAPADAGALAIDGGSSSTGGDAATADGPADAGSGQAPSTDGGPPAGDGNGPVTDGSGGPIADASAATSGNHGADAAPSAAPSTTSASSTGCGCSTPPADRTSGGALAAMAIAMAILRTRARRRRSEGSGGRSFG